MGATGALNAFDNLLQLSVAVDLATEVVLTGLSAYLFHMALTAERLRLEREELRREAGGVLILCCALMALARVTIMDVLCLGRVAAVLCVMVSSFGAGAAEGALIGVITGLSMDLASPATPIFTICYGFAGLMSGVLKRQGRLVFLLVFLASNTLAVFWNWEANPCLPALYEAFCASVIFFVLPAKTMTFIVSMVQRPALGEGESGVRRYTAARTRALADAFRELYETVRRSAESKENDADVATVYDRAAEEVCVRCPRKEKCWQENYMDTLTLLNDATAAMRRRGHLELADLPARFREQCKSSAPFTAAVNSELRALIYRRAAPLTAAGKPHGGLRTVPVSRRGARRDQRGSALRDGSDTIAERRLVRYLNSLDIDAEVSVFRDPTGRLPRRDRECETSDPLSGSGLYAGGIRCAGRPHVPPGVVQPERYASCSAGGRTSCRVGRRGGGEKGGRAGLRRPGDVFQNRAGHAVCAALGWYGQRRAGGEGIHLGGAYFRALPPLRCRTRHGDEDTELRYAIKKQRELGLCRR